MKRERPSRGIRRTLGSDHNEVSSASGHFATWREVDAELEVRARGVLVLDSIESGDVRMAETCLLQLLDDLDVAELLTAKAA